ncbi:hypothetical protein KY285_017871 [Solanum tuberosum]|uniref:uncharacterized protein LOC125857969 n=1 Tax=Solanum stenotomum TaxID=172797 RepID=UPI001E86CF98|nr:uncharacterized protein LOC125857969 [Solanum stenotomum]KAH0690668.1 hypothetical protein KY289_018026 [Solanum tuberosum]KAH0703593.1 hypothetical protein KY285_017871 [Solanum tuberosum]
MSSMLGSQGFVLATAMAVSAGTVILLDLFRVKYFPATHLSDYPHDHKQILKSCLSSAGKNKDKTRKKKKKVQFAADVKSSSGNGEEYRRKQMRKFTESRIKSCGNEIVGIPGNRMALYTGILKDRVQRMGFSH